MRAEHLAHLVHQLAAVLPDGQGDVRRGPPQRHDHHVALRGRRGDVEAIKESFVKLGGKITEELYLPFPQVEFQALITQIAQKKPDAVFAFFAGGGAVKFVKDYAAAGLRASIPLYGPGFLTDGTLPAQGAAPGHQDHAALRRRPRQSGQQEVPRGVQAEDRAGRRRLRGAGLRAAALLNVGLTADERRLAAKDAMYAAMRAAKIDSPARADQLLQGQQRGAEHLPARGQGRAEPLRLGRACRSRRSGAGLPRVELISFHLPLASFLSALAGRG